MADKVNGRTTGKSVGKLLRQAKRRNKSVFARVEINHYVGRSANCIFQEISNPVFSVQKLQHQFFLWVNKKKILLGFVVDKKVIPQEYGLRQKDRISTLEINPLEDIPVERIKHSIKELIRKYNLHLNESRQTTELLNKAHSDF